MKWFILFLIITPMVNGQIFVDNQILELGEGTEYWFKPSNVTFWIERGSEMIKPKTNIEKSTKRYFKPNFLGKFLIKTDSYEKEVVVIAPRKRTPINYVSTTIKGRNLGRNLIPFVYLFILVGMLIKR